MGNKKTDDKNLDNKIKKEMEDLTSTLNKYSMAYYKDARPLVSDVEYDRLYDKLLKLEQKYPQYRLSYSPTLRVGDDLDQNFEDVQHTIPVLSLDKAYDITDLEDFISRVKKVVGNKTFNFSLEEKIDGLSVVLYYMAGKLSVAATRGNGQVGSDITKGIATIKTIPLELPEKIDIAVRGEIYLDKISFEKINKTLTEPYSNARNLAAGLIKRQKSSQIVGCGLNIFVYEGFIQNGDDNSTTGKFNSHRTMLEYLKSLGFRTNDNISFFN